MPGSPDSTAAIAAARTSLAAFGRKMAADRLVTGSAGNISVRVGDALVMTPSGISYDQVTAASVCVLDAGGTVLDGAGQRSSEWPMHRRIYDLTRASAIVHTHSPHAVAISTVRDEIPAIHYSILRLGGPTVRVAPYTTFGSDELAERTSAALDGRTGALLQNHGAVAHGRSLDEAYDRALLIEWLAEVYWRALLVGTPRVLDQAELDAVSDAARRHRYAGGGS